MKTAIVFYSKHHGSTKKLLDAIAAEHDVALIDAAEMQNAELTDYEMIGFASGIYYSKFHKSVLDVARKNLPQNKRVFFLYTYGAKKEGYTRAIAEAVKPSGAAVVGEYGCYGFNTFGPFKLIGGIAKGRPNEADIEQAVQFYCGLTDQ